MLFWVLLSLNLVLDPSYRLSWFVASGVCFGVAVLSKETALFLLPVMLLIACNRRRPHHGRFSTVLWLVPMLIVISWYPLYALLQGEFLPSSVSLPLVNSSSSVTTHVSMLETWRWPLLRSASEATRPDFLLINRISTDWLSRDFVLVIGSALAVLANLVRGVGAILR